VCCSVLQRVAACLSMLQCVLHTYICCADEMRLGVFINSYTYVYMYAHIDRKKPPPPGGFPIYYVPSSRTVSKRTPLEAPGTNSSSGVLLLTVLDVGT